MERLFEDLSLSIMKLVEQLEISSKYGFPLTRQQASEYLQVNPDTLYRWSVEEGRIAYSRLGDGNRASLRYRREDLDDFINRSRIPTVEERTISTKI